jgi:hypothetical protein
MITYNNAPVQTICDLGNVWFAAIVWHAMVWRAMPCCGGGELEAEESVATVATALPPKQRIKIVADKSELKTKQLPLLVWRTNVRCGNLWRKTKHPLM